MSTGTLPVRKRLRLGPGGYALLHFVHLLVAAIWVGSALAIVITVAFVMNADTILGTYQTASMIDLFVWRPCTFTMLVSGIVFSVFTHWRFFRHRWITVKYVINIVPIALGYAVLSRPMAAMTDQVRALRAAAWSSPPFQNARHLFLAEQSVAWLLLLTAVVLGAYKPRLGQRRARAGVEVSGAPGSVTVDAILSGHHATVESDRNTTVLDALLMSGEHPPYSCKSGVCSTCRARITSGSAVMKTNSVLTDDEIADGALLTCQALPTTSHISVDYDHTN